jgi:hypothetical protein
MLLDRQPPTLLCFPLDALASELVGHPHEADGALLASASGLPQAAGAEEILALDRAGRPGRR